MSKKQFFTTLLCSTLLAGTLGNLSAFAQEGVIEKEPEMALEVLRKLKRNPSIAHSMDARNDALLTTGSVVKDKGLDRVLYHLPANEQGLRLGGETAAKEWPVYIARQQLDGPVTFRLAYKNAVSVMPEASNIAIEVNGVMVGKRPIQSPNRSHTLSFNVPNHILVPGYNSVRVLARQRHRVDCSIDATHELWTDIDPTRTGFVFGKGNSALNSLDAIAALARSKGGQIRLRVMSGDMSDPHHVGRAILLAQHTAVYADFQNALVEVADGQGRGPGLDIFTGTSQQLAAIAPQYAKAVRDNSSLQILSRDGDERVAIILLTDAAMEEAQFRKKLAMTFPKRTARGSAQGLQAAARARSNSVAEGQAVSFENLGFQSEEFDGRLFRKSMQVSLPSDYFAADYNQAEMHLATGYSAGLDRNNKFIIRVNGVTVTGFALSKASGHVFKNKMLRLPLSAFRPGTNEVELEVQLAKSTDGECAPRAQIGDTKRFVISGKSTLSFPRLAHLAKLPDLAGTVTSGFPYIIAGKAQPTLISVPNPGRGDLSAAASLATQIAVKAGVPLDFELSYSAPKDSQKNAIIIGAYPELPRKIAQSITGIDRSAFETAWAPGLDLNPTRQVAGTEWNSAGIDYTTTAGVSANETGFGSSVVKPAAPLKVAIAQPSSDILDSWGNGDQVTDEALPENLGFSAQVKKLVSSTFGLNSVRKTETPMITNPNSDILLSQRLSPNDDQGVWTVMTGRNELALKSGVSLLSKPSVLARVTGETVAINGIDRTVTSTITAQNFVQVRGFSLRNAHLIVAGWFSNNHFIYTLLMLSGLLVGGFVTSRLLSTLGVQVDKEGDETNAA